jgi:nucleobase:cation symporter-1, NCS1 family
MWESIGCAFGGQALIAIVITLNGRAGAVYHMYFSPFSLFPTSHSNPTNTYHPKRGFPILNRASFGIFGAWWPTFNRAVMAIVWNGVNAVQGAQCIYVMLHALTPKIAEIRNVMGPGSVLDSGGMIGFVIFWVATCCFLVIPIPKVNPSQILVLSEFWVLMEE